MMITLNPQLPDLLAQHNWNVSEFADFSGVNRSTINGILKPKQHPHRRGGMLRTTAWKIAKAYAQIAEISDKDAYQAVIIDQKQ